MTAAALFLCAALPAGAWTWAPPPEHVEIGTPLTLAARVEAPAGPLKPLPGQNKGSYEVLDASLAADGTAAVKVMVFALGRQPLPPLRWAAGDKEVSSPAFELTVIPPPPRPSDTGDIRDIRGPYRARMGAWWALLALLAGAAAYAVWRLTRKAPPEAARGAAQAPADLRTPEERALDALEALTTLGLPVKEFYDRLSDIVRQYLLERHGVEALRMTTYGIQRALIREGFPPPARQAVKELFERCDLAKFAKMRPTDQEGRRDLDAAKCAVKLLAPAASGLEGDLALGAKR
ncbi:MAG: hypothetical protein HY928_04610 [Elusimicrobia bacterium]|nr:hypothetical protein [Elusimicrobiota bacterium]